MEVAKLHPELSPRLLAVKITVEEHFTVSESTIYRILKQKGLVSPRPLPEMPAAKEWKKKTTRPDESSFSVSDVVEMAIENARREGHLSGDERPKLYTDNGPCFTSWLMADYLASHGIKHIFGTPYHPARSSASTAGSKRSSVWWFIAPLKS